MTSCENEYFSNFPRSSVSLQWMYNIAFLVIVFISMSYAQQESPDEREWEALQAVADSNLQFSNSLYEILSEKEGNVFFSPISIEVALALTYMGARGETALQMAKGLHLSDDDELVTTGFNGLLTSLKSTENIILNIANKIYTENSIPLKKEFEEIAQNYFLSEVESVDFVTNFEAARVQINLWVEGQTNKKIPELLSEGELSFDTSSVLVNAIYFKGDWSNQFNPHDTRTRQFFVTSTETKDVQMMHKTSKAFGYGVNSNLDCQVLELPYKGKSLSLIVLLPNKMDGLAYLESKLHTVDLKQLMINFEFDVQVSMPKFKLEESIDLKEVLKKLGMVDMFGRRANFSGMTDTPLFVSSIVHQALIEVDETGSEAVAATRRALRPLMAVHNPPKIHRVVVDHPFLFAIVHKKLRTPLFVGRYAV